MASQTPLFLVAASYAVMSASTVGASTAQLAAIDVNIRADSSAAVITLIAQFGRPSNVMLTGDKTVKDVIQQRCGVVSPAYVSAFLLENKSAHGDLTADMLESPQTGTEFTFPYCLRPKSETVTRGNKLVTQLFAERNLLLDAKGLQDALSKTRDVLAPRALATLKLFGITKDSGSNSGFVATEQALRFLRLNPGLQYAQITANKLIKIDPVTRTDTVPLRENAKVDDALQQLNSVSKNVTANAATVAELVDGDDPIELHPGTCQGADKNPNWPISIAELKTAIADLNQFRPAGLSPASVTALIIDTGYDVSMGSPAIPITSLGKLRGVGIDADDLPMYAGINSVDPYSNDPTPPLELKTRLHGGEVAATLLGGGFLPPDDHFLPLPKITFASIATENAGKAYLDIGAISAAIDIALDNQITVVNASVAAGTRRKEFADAMRSSEGKILLITAAGNVLTPPQEFDPVDQTWPGSMGGSPTGGNGGIILSVGAHDVQGRPLYFTRLGRRQVDLLAPGCNIPTYTLDPVNHTVVPVARNGTSYATPIVTMIASVLASQGLRPAAIKDRLIISADVDESLVRYTWSGGRLNPVKALSLWRDMVDYDVKDAQGVETHRRAIGKLLNIHQKIALCGNAPFEAQQLRKLTYSSDPESTKMPAQWRGWRKAIAASTLTGLDPLDACPVSGNKLEGELQLDVGTPEPLHIPLNDVRDFVSRWPVG